MVSRILLSFITLLFIVNNSYSQEIFRENKHNKWGYEIGKWGVKDYKGNVLFKPVYDKILKYNYFGLAKVRYTDKKGNTKYGIIDKKGARIIAPIYNSIYSFRSHNYYSPNITDPPPYVVYIDHKAGVINKEGTFIVPLGKYEHIRPHKNDGLSIVTLNKKNGIINYKGEEIIPPQYERLDYFSDSMFIFQEKGKHGIINSKGIIKQEAIYDKIITSNYNKSINLAFLGNKVGALNKFGP